ncbi:MAG TPA: HD-GYP domain-containing protein [Chloroflexota bacterium]|jgi:putative nucleotidyltransferase with HDIG domain|nr:HD-GYP domain-containing protein [Chloroflexota bacterium]
MNDQLPGEAHTDPMTADGTTADPLASVAYWQEQALIYATELQHLYKSERAGRARLAEAQAQLMKYATDLRIAFQAERERRQELQRAYLETIHMLAAAVEARDPYTGGHLERVTRYTIALGRALNWSREDLNIAEMGAILHDIGKIGIRDAILCKEGPLTAEEWAHMREHPVIGARILEGITFLRPVIPYVRHHHERYDGTGYPDGLRGEAIPIGGRLIAVADAFDAMTTSRPYRQALPVEDALAELRRAAGSQLDPVIVEAFLAAYARGEIIPDCVE